MPDSVVLDSCIIAAVFFPEGITDRAIEIVEGHDCTTVDLAYVEVANVAWKRVRHSGQDLDIIRSSLADSQAFIRETCHVVPARDLVPAAYDLACSHGITIYDALFVAATVQCGTCLVTGDGRLHDAAKKVVTTYLVR
ncbi:type II toxin-antitoxin system VapC family toxin [Methanoculleus sp. YWC-01]|jgi:predicted nucleic acid-binding protein|uniref:Type II toxin-antitoxin system VapC family toxin n=1 Tax=Methanoculleus nereidis TaxID=2735141 RepID=A0ABU3Z2Y6_9EURY|nr:type II toxin-antitoxin system VapC family toxin [Methanoculleus sp. YWC-01]MDV4343173.1 type II toxin-antitoxin system VapC family toxin [Methanoculleus sp. YWC-01]